MEFIISLDKKTAHAALWLVESIIYQIDSIFLVRMRSVTHG